MSELRVRQFVVGASVAFIVGLAGTLYFAGRFADMPGGFAGLLGVAVLAGAVVAIAGRGMIARKLAYHQEQRAKATALAGGLDAGPLALGAGALVGVIAYAILGQQAGLAAYAMAGLAVLAAMAVVWTIARRLNGRNRR